MTDLPLNLNELLHGARQQVIEQVSNYVGAMLKGAPDGGWELAAVSLGNAVDEMLNVDTSGILLNGFKKAKKIRRSLNKSRHHPEKNYSEPLHDCTIRSYHHPVLEVFDRHKKLCEVRFDVDIYLTIESAILDIQEGEIISISSGRCILSGKVGIGKFSVKIFSNPYEIPGTFFLESHTKPTTALQDNDHPVKAAITFVWFAGIFCVIGFGAGAVTAAMFHDYALMVVVTLFVWLVGIIVAVRKARRNYHGN